MKTDVPVEVVPVSLPWYRTRKFWAIVLTTGILLNSIILYPLISLKTFLDFFNTIIGLLGGSSVWFLLSVLFGHFKDIHLFSSILYTPIFLFLVYYTFRKRTVSFFYPLLLLILIIITLIIGVVFMGSYS